MRDLREGHAILASNIYGGNDKDIALSAMLELQPHASQRQIAFLAFDGVQSLDVTGPMEVFAVANSQSQRNPPPYRLILTSTDGSDIATHAGFKLGGATALEDLPPDLDTIVIAGGGPRELVSAMTATALLDWIRARSGRTRRVASICTGAFVLAASGLLDGRRATTHWRNCDQLQALWPLVQLEPDAIFVADPPFYTSAGVTAGIDLCLSLVEADLGADAALEVARELVLFLRRPGGQSQFCAALTVQASASPQMASLVRAVIEDPRGDFSAPAMASRVGMSERNFARVFRRETGQTPARFVEAARIDRAKALLESAHWPLDRVAERAGFRTLDALHRAFAQRLGVTPGDYRARFGRSV